MFEVGQYIIYGNTGVCKIEEIKKMAAPGTKEDRLYYVLDPVYDKGCRLFTPVDNQKIIMRSVLTKEEAEELISRMKDIEVLWVADEKNREQMYKEAIRSCNCEEWVRIIKTLYMRKMSRLAEGKKVTSSDAKYLHLAEENFYGELSIALGIPKSEMEEFITQKIEQ
ncbi:MAG: CarD family transcriptional regulator [Lachnospiraceae bacterium]|nr:CarD family transcriptional regulator [Lachnospiraceae bacterium]